ncbi:hypothetical protein DPMN_022945 [Dreissena polymorpha]|uniref:Uncharacterized protein n=1 Tax=Dreissena polymorpha TaxID=45954 RepID=A0A9D4LM43_DREPO|nr:hypothetical protein DPMN_022945 [Dreissena polymorpha]
MDAYLLARLFSEKTRAIVIASSSSAVRRLASALETFRHIQSATKTNKSPHYHERKRQPLCLYCQEVGPVRTICPHNVNAIFKDKHTDNSKTRKATASAQAFTPAQKQAEEEPPSQEDEKGFKTVKIRKKNQGKAEKTKDSKSTEEMDTQKSEVRVSKRIYSPGEPRPLLVGGHYARRSVI